MVDVLKMIKKLVKDAPTPIPKDICNDEQYCYVCNEKGSGYHIMQLVHSRVGIGSIHDIYVCEKHYQAYKRGENLMQLHNERWNRFITYINCGLDDYGEFKHE